MSPSLAFFDMDDTLLDTSSSMLYVKHLRRTGKIGRRGLMRAGWWALLYKASLINMAKAMPKMLAYAQGTSVSETLQESREWFAATVVSHISLRATKLIRWHQAQGHHPVVISASTQFAVQPVAEYLQLDFLCTWLEVKNDRLTGGIVEPACYGQGKIFWAERYAARHATCLSDAYFYSDSLSDLPLLERVGHPIAVNPDPRLKRVARRRDWPIEKFH